MLTETWSLHVVMRCTIPPRVKWTCIWRTLHANISVFLRFRCYKFVVAACRLAHYDCLRECNIWTQQIHIEVFFSSLRIPLAQLGVARQVVQASVACFFLQSLHSPSAAAQSVPLLLLRLPDSLQPAHHPGLMASEVQDQTNASLLCIFSSQHSNAREAHQAQLGTNWSIHVLPTCLVMCWT